MLCILAGLNRLRVTALNQDVLFSVNNKCQKKKQGGNPPPIEQPEPLDVFHFEDSPFFNNPHSFAHLLDFAVNC